MRTGQFDGVLTSGALRTLTVHGKHFKQQEGGDDTRILTGCTDVAERVYQTEGFAIETTSFSKEMMQVVGRTAVQAVENTAPQSPVDNATSDVNGRRSSYGQVNLNA